MTDAAVAAEVTVGGVPLTQHDLKPPFVSIVLVNRNYEAFVGEAIDSIRAQDYPHFECVIVDNASTDDSRAVIARHVGDDVRFTIVHLAENLGQLRAALGVFDRLRGEYVVCADADDVLFRSFLSSHLQVHLALTAAVGFSSSDIVEVDAERTVLTGGRSGFAFDCEAEPPGLKPAREVMRIAAVSDADYAALAEATCIAPLWKARWIWSPGTANMYRKSVLGRALPDTARIKGHAAWDNYFCPIVHLMSGSALIRRHLSAYRFHDRNAFAHTPRILALQTSRGFAATRSAVQRLHVLHTFLSRADEFDWLLAGDRFWVTIDLLASIEGLTPRAFFAQAGVQEIVADNLRKLEEVFGRRAALRQVRARMRAGAAWRVIAKAYGGQVPFALRLELARAMVHRLLTKR